MAVGALVASAPLAAHPAPGATFVNPLFKGGDPWVTRYRGVYYYSASNCGIADICVKHARTLTGLAKARWIGVWNHADASTPNAHDVWAPELHHIKGRWYIYYAADDGDNDHHRLYVLSADNPLGPFKEAHTGLPHGRLEDSTDHWAIDPDVFTAADGKLYLTWSCTNHSDARFPQRICLARLRDPTHISSPTAFISTPTRPWETRGKPIQEGPVGYTRDGHTYITYSASASWIANDYAVGLLALTPGASPLNPSSWTKSGPIFDHHGGVYGPGSVVFVPSPDGTQYWNLYHAIDRTTCSPAYDCRDIRMQRMHFDAKGAPVLGDPVDPGVPLHVPSGDEGAVASGSAGSGRWIGAWSASMLKEPIPPAVYRKQPQTTPALDYQTVRMMLQSGAPGSRVRIRISNRFGTHPLHIDASSIGKRARAAGPALIGSSLHALRFGGRRQVTIPAGATYLSDPVHMSIRAGESLGVSLFVRGKVTPRTWHPDARMRNYISARGDFTQAADMPVQKRIGGDDWLSGIEVTARAGVGVIVALGDSITNGYQSSVDANARYTDALMRRLRKAAGHQCVRTVLNEGIDGNQVAAYHGTYGTGQSMVQRFDRDVLGQSGVHDVVVLGGINDIGEPTMVARARGGRIDADTTARHVIQGLRQIIRKAHAAGLRVYGATLTPFTAASGAYSTAGEQARQQINTWIRHSGQYDAVIDFDAAMRDPAHPERIRPEYDSGDHLHPNDRGYSAMAAAVPLRLFGCH